MGNCLSAFRRVGDASHRSRFFGGRLFERSVIFYCLFAFYDLREAFIGLLSGLCFSALCVFIGIISKNVVLAHDVGMYLLGGEDESILTVGTAGNQVGSELRIQHA